MNSHARPAVAFLVLLLAAIPVYSQNVDTTTVIRVRGFVDTYYANDFTRPADGERRFTTQPVRHNEANVNLTWLGVTVERAHVRARVALQAGTSVQSNYASEPQRGSTSGPDVSRFIQEAVTGVKLTEKIWIDAGIYASYIGSESWSSSDNPTYTRSLVAEYTPYYLSGVKLTWHPLPSATAQLHIMNGWQNISENNNSKAVGARLDWSVAPTLTVSYANFIGNERNTGKRSVPRVFHQILVQRTLPSGAQWRGQADLGGEASGHWYGGVVVVRQPVTPRVALVGRVERYSDPDQVIVKTGVTSGFVGNGASLGVDVHVDSGVRWRSEFRRIHTTAALFPAGPDTRTVRVNNVLVSSLSYDF